jgi:hypothetical protein
VRKTLNCLYVPSIDIKLAIISPSHYQWKGIIQRPRNYSS